MSRRFGRHCAMTAGLCAALACVFAQAAPFAYVATLDGTITVIDTETSSAMATIAAGYYPLGVGLSPDGGHAYVANAGNASVVVIDTSDNHVERTLQVGPNPAGIAVLPDGRVYVTESSDTFVAVIDPVTYAVSHIAMPFAQLGIAAAPDGQHVYVTFPAQNGAAEIDTATNAVSNYMPVEQRPIDVAVSVDGNLLFVTNADSGTISIMFLRGPGAMDSARTVSQSPMTPAGIAVAPDGAFLYVVATNDDTVRVFEMNDYTEVDSIAIGVTGLNGIAVTPDGGHLYVQSTSEPVVAIVDTVTHAVTTVATGWQGAGGLGHFIGPPLPRYVTLCTQMVDNGDDRLDGGSFSVAGTWSGSTLDGGIGPFDFAVFENQTPCGIPFQLPVFARAVAAAESLPDGFVSAPGYPRWLLRDTGSGQIVATGDGADTGTIDLTPPGTPRDLQLVLQNQSAVDRIFADGFGP
jgi:YVTN family beta-propeller protein